MFGAGRLASVAARASQRLTIAAPGVGLAVGTAGCYKLLTTSPAAGAPHCEARTTMAMTPAASSVHFASRAVAQKTQDEQVGGTTQMEMQENNKDEEFSNFELPSSPSTPTPPASTPTPVVVPKAKVEAPEAVENFTQLISDRNVALEAVKKDGHALARAAPALRRDRALVLEAVKQSGLALQYAAPELRADRECVLEAVRESGRAMQFASTELQEDAELFKEGGMWRTGGY
mmetsp:Transcript_71409/g.192286  ORF Transcript_71409/g.192286 Transcript_71409/m.192286 type:complete len:232 (-) Transcript_71409:247-942(-)